MKKLIYFLLILLLVNTIKSQNIRIFGYVSDKITKEKIINAIVVLNNYKSVQTNEFGYFSIDLNKDSVINITFKYLGYNDTSLTLKTNENKRIDIFLTPNNEITAINITGTRKNTIFQQINTKEIKLLPSIFGEQDIIKSIQFLPGVQFGIEGSSDIFVRGGTPDQNLIILDDIPLRNVNHFGSFFSIFDINAINSVKFYKSNFPTKYGSTMSSIIDIRMKDGSMDKLNGEFMVGLVASKLSLNGPIVKNKLSFISNIRFCNFGIASIILKSMVDNFDFYYYFYDVNLKFNYLLSKKDKIDFTIYNGRDVFIYKFKEKDTTNNNYSIYEDKNTIAWGNILTSLRWTHVYNSMLFHKTVIGFTYYDFNTINSYNVFEKDSLISEFNIYSKKNLSDIYLKHEYELYVNSKNNLIFGSHFFYHNYTPFNTKSELSENSNIQEQQFSLSKYNTYDINLFIDYQLNLNRFLFNIGALANIYYNSTITKNYMFTSSINFNISKNNSLSFSFDKTFQNYHLISASNNIAPNDLWVPATKYAESEYNEQFSFSYFHISKSLNIDFSLFYKTQNNLLYFKQLNLIFDSVDISNFENLVEKDGKSRIYGLEFGADKSFKKFKIQVSYTLMYNYRQFQNVNNNKPFPFVYDRRHFFQTTFIFNVSKNFNFSSNFVFATGYPVKIAHIYQKLIDPNILNYYPSHIQQTYEIIVTNDEFIRLPNYHRLDIAANWSKKLKKGTRTWSVNIYNVYNRFNAMGFYVIYNYDREKYELRKNSIFPIIPSISYSYKF